MEPSEIAYLRWFKESLPVTHDLCDSCISGIAPKEIGIKSFKDIQSEDLGFNEFYPGSRDLLAEELRLPPEELYVAQGASPANFLVNMLLVEKGDTVLVESPVYEPLARLPEMFGAKVKYFERTYENNYQPDIEGLKEMIDDKTKLIVLTDLHNPSSVKLMDQNCFAIGDLADDHNVKVLVDEVYRDAVSITRVSGLSRLSPNIIATNSFTKSYGMAGLRYGWIEAESSFIQKLRVFQNYHVVVHPQVPDMIARKAIPKMAKLRARTHSILEPNYKIIRGWLQNHPYLEQLPAVTPAGVTVFPRFKPKYRGVDTVKLVHHLIVRENMAVVPGHFFRAPGHIRLGLGKKTPKEFKRLLPILDRGLKTWFDHK